MRAPSYAPLLSAAVVTAATEGGDVRRFASQVGACLWASRACSGARQPLMGLWGGGCTHLARPEGNSIHTRVYIRRGKKKNRPDTGVTWAAMQFSHREIAVQCLSCSTRLFSSLLFLHLGHALFFSPFSLMPCICVYIYVYIHI